MSIARFLPDSRSFVLVGALILGGALPGLSRAAAPTPKDVFTADTSMGFYVDMDSARGTAVWKLLEAQLPGVLAGFKGLIEQQTGTSVPMDQLFQPGIGEGSGSVAELAVSVSGDMSPANLQANQLPADLGFVAAFRMSGVNAEEVMAQALQALEAQQPGLKSEIEASKTKLGEADVYTVPRSLLEEGGIPFEVKVGVQPTAQGTLMTVGRSDALKQYLESSTTAVTGPAVESVSRGSQFWFFANVPEGAMGNLAGMDPSMTQGNPMVAGVLDQLKTVRQLGVGLTLGERDLGYRLALGCADASGSQQLAGIIQGLTGMAQMGLANDPNFPAPSLMRNLRVSSRGAVVTIDTAISIQDLQKVLRQAGGGMAGSSSSSAARPSPAPDSSTTRVVTQDPVEVEVVELVPGTDASMRWTRVKITNRSGQPIDEMRATFIYYDDRGKRMGQWTRTHSDPTTETLVEANSERVVRLPAFRIPRTTESLRCIVHEVVFGDGSKWVPGR